MAVLVRIGGRPAEPLRPKELELLLPRLKVGRVDRAEGRVGFDLRVEDFDDAVEGGGTADQFEEGCACGVLGHELSMNR